MGPFISEEKRDVIQRAQAIYSSLLRQDLDPSYSGKYVSIEPDSGDYFLGESIFHAIDAALTKHPKRLVHTIRIGD
jgi:hypothetical protein